MKAITSIVILAAAIGGLGIAGCEYYDQNPVYTPPSQDQRSTDADRDPHARQAARQEDPSEATVPQNRLWVPERSGANDDQDLIEEDNDPALEGVDDAMVEDEGVIIDDENSTSQVFFYAEPYRPQVMAYGLINLDQLTTPFTVTPSSLTIQLRDRGGLNFGGRCFQNAPDGPEAGVALKTALKITDGGEPNVLTGVYLGCRKTQDWINPDRTDRSREWNDAIRYDESVLPSGARAYGRDLPAGRALIGVKLLRCYSEDRSIPTDLCGLAGLFRSVHRDGTIEETIEEEQIPQQEDYVRSPDFETVIRCPDPDEVVTGLNYRQPDASDESPVTWVELFCSRVERAQ